MYIWYKESAYFPETSGGSELHITFSGNDFCHVIYIIILYKAGKNVLLTHCGCAYCEEF
jgi:hypothetical protein